MRVFVEVARRSFQRHLAYRGTALAGILANIVFGLIIASVYSGFYASKSDSLEVGGFDLTQMLTYVWFGQSLISVLAMWSWYDIARTVQSGEIVTDLMRPVDYYAFWFSRDAGRAASQIILRGITTLAAGAVLFDLALPSSVGRWLEFLTCVALAVVVSFSLRFMVSISAVWLTDVIGVMMIYMVALDFFSGFLVPISFFPDWLNAVSNLLPFRAMVMAPITVAIGQSPFWRTAGLQVLWVVVLSLLANWMLSRATRRLEIYGG